MLLGHGKIELAGSSRTVIAEHLQSTMLRERPLTEHCKRLLAANSNSKSCLQSLLEESSHQSFTPIRLVGR